jgi:Arc/MetJ-type ribon-helix-helix transcriptional regulator
MTIHLPKDVEGSINAEVMSGHFASTDDAIAEAWRAYLQQRTQASQAKASRLDELHRQMLADGLLSQLPNSADDIDDDQEEPVEIDGEPLSETIIRERR